MVKRTKRIDAGEGAVGLVRQLVEIRRQKALFAEREAAVKERLVSMLEADGYIDDKGHRWFDLPTEVEGADGKLIRRIQHQRRVSQILNAVSAEVELKKLGMWEDCSMEVTVLDEDSVLALRFQNKIPDKAVREIFEEKVTWAFNLTK